mgnify:CR=1 FL=1
MTAEELARLFREYPQIAPRRVYPSVFEVQPLPLPSPPPLTVTSREPELRSLFGEKGGIAGPDNRAPRSVFRGETRQRTFRIVFYETEPAAYYRVRRGGGVR